MNHISIFTKITDNYIQLFDFSEIENTSKTSIEILELKTDAWAGSFFTHSELKLRLIFWDHKFLETETNYWFYIKYSLWEKFFKISNIPVIVQGSFHFNELIDTEKDLFYSKIIVQEEIQIQSKKILVLERNSNLSEILKLT